MAEDTKNIIIRPMTIHDVPQVHAIEKATFTMPWSMVAFQYELLNNHLSKYYVMAERDEQGPIPGSDQVIGYLGFWFVIDEAHITTLAISADYQGYGYGNKFLAFALETARLNKIEQISLEVRVSNEKAIGLYKKFGFKEAGIRRKYYTDNDEDAIVMWLSLVDEGEVDREIGDGNSLTSEEEELAAKNETSKSQERAMDGHREDKKKRKEAVRGQIRSLLDLD